MAIEYIPLPPPQNPEGMAAYLNTELLRISQAIRSVSVAARGSLYLAATSATQTIGTTPVLLTAFDTEVDPDTLRVDISSNSITALFGGSYSSTLDTTVSTGSNNVTITFSIYVNNALWVSATDPVFAKTSGEPVPLSLTVTGQVPRGGKLEVFANVASGTEALTFTRLRWGVSGIAID